MEQMMDFTCESISKLERHQVKIVKVERETRIWSPNWKEIMTGIWGAMSHKSLTSKSY